MGMVLSNRGAGDMSAIQWYWPALITENDEDYVLPIKNAVVLDVENTVSEDEDRSPSAFVTSNELVAVGFLSHERVMCRIGYGCHLASPDSRSSVLREMLLDEPLGAISGSTVLIGHNIKHDLQWLCRELPELQDHLPRKAVWDTMIAEYVLSGQKNKFPSLEFSLQRFHLSGKGDIIKQYLDNGDNVDDIPKNDLVEYLADDLRLTHLLAGYQMREAIETGQFKLILAMCQATLAITQIEMSGMWVDLDQCVHIRSYAKGRIQSRELDFLNLLLDRLDMGKQGKNNTLMHPSCKTMGVLPHNIGVSKTKLLQTVLYGGTYELQTRVKTSSLAGKPKSSILRHTVTFPALTTSSSTTKSGKPSVSEETFNQLIADGCDADTRRFIDIIRDYRLASKINETYLGNVTKNSKPVGSPELHRAVLHGKIHQTSTDTGRTSSSQPNLQNFPNSDEYDLKSIFVSRYCGGSIVEVDFKQLELVCMAEMCSSEYGKLLANAIESGVDVHYDTAFKRLGSAPSDEERRVQKTINFGLLYGGTAKSLAVQAGVPEDDARAAIRTFYLNFPDVRSTQEDFIHRVREAVARYGILRGHTPKGLPVRSVLANPSEIAHSITKRVYYFEEQDSPWGANNVSVSPTKIKNYPIQGLATGDIVPLVLGILYRRLFGNPEFRDKVHIINTIHDSFILDVHPSILPQVIDTTVSTMEDTPNHLKKYFSYDKWELPVKVSVKVGPTWAELAEYNK